MTEQKHEPHNLVIEDRKRISISGVKEIEGFTETEVCLYTEAGQLTVKGRNLKVELASVETGKLTMNGDMINSITYSEKIRRTPDNFITKLFR